MLAVFVALDDERALQLCRNLHIIISVDAQDVLYDVARTLDVHTVGRHLDGHGLGRLAKYLHLQRGADILNRLMRYILTYQRLDITEVKFYLSILYR